jgi:hypothetical protein
MRHAALVSENVSVHVWYDARSDLFCGQITDDDNPVAEDCYPTSYNKKITHDEVIRTYGPADSFTDTVGLIVAIREDLTALEIDLPADAAQELSELLDDDAASAAHPETAPRDHVLAAH